MKIKHSYFLLILALIFFVIYSYVSFNSPPKFVSPDETTNYFFGNLYSQTGELRYTDKLNEIAFGIIRPRATVYIDGNVVPAKFMGFPLIIGTIATITPEMVRFITPLLAIIGAIFLYLLVRDLFNSKIALLSFLLLLVMPPYWYWSTLVMFENVAACTMFIISIRYFFKFLETNEASHYLLSGLFLGLSLFIRPDYILFVIPLLILFLWNIRKINKAYAVLTVVSFTLSLSPFFILNKQLYGHFLSTGTHVLYNASQVIPIFSFNIANIFENSFNLINLTPLLLICGLLGLLYCIKKRIRSQYMVFLIICSLVISFYFLSGRIVPTGIHNSYVRYLLPIYMLSLPLVSYLVYSLRTKFVIVLLILVMLVTSIFTVLPAIHDNLESIEGYARLNRQVVNVTEPNAVIFLDYWDKAIFPERRVGLVGELPQENRNEKLSEIIMQLFERGVPVYLLIEQHFRQLIANETLVQEFLIRGYRLKETKMKNLYQLERIKEK